MKEEDGWEDFDAVFWIKCRHLKVTLKRYLETEIPEANEMWDNTISLEKNLKHLSVCWIIDGFDEKSRYFEDFVDILKEEFESNHTFIVTTRPNVKPPSLKLDYVILKPLDNEQIQMILHTLIDDSAKVKTFLNDMKEHDHKKLLDTPLNLNLLATLITDNKLKLDDFNKVENKTLMLYDKTLRSSIEKCICRHKNQTELDDDELTENVELWFEFLCKIAAECLRERCFVVSDDHLKRLKKESKKQYLLPKYCLSTFLDCDNNVHSSQFKHRTQQEAMAVRYLRDDLSFEDMKQFFMEVPPSKELVITFLKLGEMFNAKQFVILLKALYYNW